jgi:mannose-6-phosphate isomerase-like protein (cupin superfamily)
MEPSCNISTVLDGRGGIFTWNPTTPVEEWNFMYCNPGKIRGNHYHPEFDEYILITMGNGLMISKDTPDSPEESIYLGRGDCVYIPQNTPHAFYAITECTLVSFLAKKWADCESPLIPDEIVKG